MKIHEEPTSQPVPLFFSQGQLTLSEQGRIDLENDIGFVIDKTGEFPNAGNLASASSVAGFLMNEMVISVPLQNSARNPRCQGNQL